MSVVRGDVKLRVEMTGDGASAKKAVKDVREEVEKTTKSASLLGDESGAVKGKMDELKGSVGGVNALREGFEQIRSNAFFAVGVVTTLVSGVGALIEALGGASLAMEKWTAAREGMDAGLQQTKSLIEQINRLLGRGPNEFEGLLIKAEERLTNINEAIAAGTLAVEEQREEWDTLTALMPGLALAHDTMLDGLKEDQRDILKLEGDRYKLSKKTEEAYREQARLTREQAELIRFIRGDKALPANDDRTPGAPGEYDPDLSLKGFGDAVRAAQADRARGGRGPRSGAGPGRFVDPADVINPLRSRGTGVEFSSGGPENQMQPRLERVVPLTERLAKALNQVADATLLVAGVMPEYGAALSEIQEITDQVVAGKMALNEAIVAGAVAIAANAAHAVGGVRAEAAVRSAYEFGMGWATLDNPPISAGHFLASGLLGAVAGGAGGSGGAARTSVASSARSTRVSTATQLGETPFQQNIYAPWFGGLQEGSAYLWEVYQRGAGTGYAEAA